MYAFVRVTRLWVFLGIVCTWPIAWRKGDYRRETLLDWVKEIAEMKKRTGIEHVSLGTDGGGHLPGRVTGYNTTSPSNTK
jgi:microsomal dipeptidase-like Zn-dependent dipeptidase